ncbi:molybdopterin converting factor subunit 1 [Parvibaculum sp.]|uniref:molybdopterin converting factor subunit 1 n=1 Tax=Parvibaculum sp. TaxID=2024848 RepID=UPI00320D87B2
MRILYFSWVRQKVGTAEEAVALPADIATVATLIDWLKSRGPGYEAAFENLKLIRAAIDQTHADLDASIAGASEIAFFPPVTGG